MMMMPIILPPKSFWIWVTTSKRVTKLSQFEKAFATFANPSFIESLQIFRSSRGHDLTMHQKGSKHLCRRYRTIHTALGKTKIFHHRSAIVYVYDIFSTSSSDSADDRFTTVDLSSFRWPGRNTFVCNKTKDQRRPSVERPNGHRHTWPMYGGRKSRDVWIRRRLNETDVCVKRVIRDFSANLMGARFVFSGMH